MNKSKKIFLIMAAIFLIILALIVIDFAKRTKFRKFGEEKKEQSFKRTNRDLPVGLDIDKKNTQNPLMNEEA